MKSNGLTKLLNLIKTNWLRLVIVVLIVVALFVSSGMGFFAYMVYNIDELPDSEQPQTSRFYYHDGELMTTQFVENRTKVSLDEVAEELIWATLAVEDSDFYDHFGFDLSGIARAAYQNFKEGRISQGGSTITQQLAKNLYLTHDRNWHRKLDEAAIALHLEKNFAKDEILEKYLNAIYYGHSTYGIEEASQLYFDKSAAELDLNEAALLAGVPRGPGYYSPFIDREAAVNRQQIVLRLMEENGFIDEKERIQAVNQALSITETPKLSRETNYAVEQILNQEIDDITEEDPDIIQQDGLDFHTTIDSHMQKTAEKIMKEHIPKSFTDENGVEQPQGAVVALDPDTGKIRALVGGRDYQESTLNRVNVARSPGSAFKPFVYAAALERDFTLIDSFHCGEISFQEEGMESPYEPTDFGGGYHNEDLTLREALVESCNVTAVKLNQEIGGEATEEMATRLGIDNSIGTHLSTPLGTSEVNLLEMTAAYAAFANGGHRVEPMILKEATDHSGDELVANSTQKEQVMDEGVAYLMTDIMQEVLGPHGTASDVGADLQLTAAGKTGTSQGYRDAYMVGYTPDLVVGVYIGADEGDPLEGTGGSLAAPVWADFIKKTSNEMTGSEFTRPDNIVEKTICSETGLLQAEYCTADSEREIFIRGTAPDQDCTEQECPYIEDPNWWEWDFWFN